MTLDQLIRSLNPEIYQNLRRAIELGRWPDGRRLTQDQRALCMEAVIHYEQVHQVAEQDRVGYIDRTKLKKTECDDPHHQDDQAPELEQPVRWMN